MSFRVFQYHESVCGDNNDSRLRGVLVNMLITIGCYMAIAFLHFIMRCVVNENDICWHTYIMNNDMVINARYMLIHIPLSMMGH